MALCTAHFDFANTLKMTFLSFPNWPNAEKMFISKSQLLVKLAFKWEKSKNAILIGEVLAHEIYIFGKRGSNVTCRKKPHQNWPNGLRDMAFWSSRFSEIDSIITCQPHMGIESSWTFWKWENKIFNFHVGQKFIWSFYHDVSWGSRSFHLWQVSVTGPISISGNFLFDFKFFHDEVGHDIWGLYRHEWTPSNQFHPSNHWLNGQLTKFDFLLTFLGFCMIEPLLMNSKP